MLQAKYTHELSCAKALALRSGPIASSCTVDEFANALRARDEEDLRLEARQQVAETSLDTDSYELSQMRNELRMLLEYRQSLQREVEEIAASLDEEREEEEESDDEEKPIRFAQMSAEAIAAAHAVRRG
eukprot:5902586-Pleurochrysis_carterae.AAC.1